MGGPSFAIAATLLALLAWLPMISAPAEVGAERSLLRHVVELRPVATALLVQQQALQSWHAGNPGTFGEVPAASLPLPAPWSPVAAARSVVQTAGIYVVGVTYYDGARFRAADLAAAMSEIAAFSGNVGLTGPAGLVSARGTAVPLPAGIPAGRAAVAMVLD